MKIRIEITKGPDSGREFVLKPNERLTIGRGGESEILMTDGLISREHCEIKCDGNHLLLRDLGSTNKTFLVQGSNIEPIEPRKIYQVAHQNSFFAGPESRFTATYLPSDAPSQRNDAPRDKTAAPEPPVNTGGSPAGGNFSNSIQTQPGGEFGASSIFNLLGDAPHHASSVQLNTRPPEPTKPAPHQPEDASMAPQRQDPQTYDAGSIAPPQNQGIPGREHVLAPTPSDPPSHGESPLDPPTREYTPQNDDSKVFSMSIETQQNVPPRALPPQQEHSPPPQSPAALDSRSQAANPMDNGSIVPPHLQGVGKMREQVGEAHDDSYLKSTPKIEDPQVHRPAAESAPPATDLADRDAPFSSSVAHKSVAAPGHVYKTRRPVEASQTPNIPQNTSVFASSVPLDAPSLDAPIATSPENPPIPEPINAQSKTAQHNGLHFHTGTDLAQLNGLIAELGAKVKPIYCVDFSRLEIEPPTETPLAESTRETPEAAEIDSGPQPKQDNDSAFEIDDEAEEQTGSADQAKSAKLAGTPLFDFLPEGHKQNGPILLTQSELDCSLAKVWGQDAVVIFFGPDPTATTEHLKKLLHTNIQTGKQFKGMFGFCWPSVLHALFESQGEAQVKRAFGDAISLVLLEDPQQRYVWNLVALSDQTDSLQELKSN